MLEPRARCGLPGETHREPAEDERLAQALERVGLAAVDRVGVLEHRIHVVAGERDGERVVAVVLADQLGEPPVRGRGVGGEQVAEPGAVELDRGLCDHVEVDQQPVRPARQRGAFDAVDEQHRLIVGEPVDAGGGLHDDVGEVEPRADRLADVGDRAGADAEDDRGALARGRGARERRLVGDDAAGERHAAQVLDGERALDLAVRSRHLDLVGDQRDRARSAADCLDGVGGAVEDAGAEQHAAEPDVSGQREAHQASLPSTAPVSPTASRRSLGPAVGCCAAAEDKNLGLTDRPKDV